MSGGETEKIARLAELVSNDICVFRGGLGCHSHGGGLLERILGRVDGAPNFGGCWRGLGEVGPVVGEGFSGLEGSGELPERPGNTGWKVERVEGIEPSTKAWEAFVLPLNYTRSERLTLYQMPGAS